jgi:hypothetical protein
MCFYCSNFAPYLPRSESTYKNLKDLKIFTFETRYLSKQIEKFTIKNVNVIKVNE